MKIDWVKTIYGPPDGRGWHVHSLVKWKERYYIAFAGGSGHDSDDSEDDDILQFVQHTVERHVRRRAAAKRLRRKRKLDWRRRKYLARGWEVPDAALTPLSRARSPSHSDRGPGRGQASPFVRKERSTMF